MDYLALLRGSPTEVAWPHIDAEKFNVLGHQDSLWLRAADVMTSGLAKGLELSQHGFCEDRFARLLKPVIYNRDGNYLSYGLKVFPGIPPVESERDNRYEWLSLYGRK